MPVPILFSPVYSQSRAKHPRFLRYHLTCALVRYPGHPVPSRSVLLRPRVFNGVLYLSAYHVRVQGCWGEAGHARSILGAIVFIPDLQTFPILQFPIPPPL